MTHHDHSLARLGCPVDQLEWYANRSLPPEEYAAVKMHLEECASCQAEVASWASLYQIMQEVSVRTPEPRDTLFAQIEAQIDLLPSSAPWSRLSLLFQKCRFVLSVCGEHCRIQTRLIRRDLFLMPLLLIPLAVSVVYLPPTWKQTPDTAALLASLLIALGTAFLYGQEVDPAREMTLSTPTSPHLILGIRCYLVFGYDLLINCGLVLPFLASQHVVTIAWFFSNWLAPLCCLSALALLLSILINTSTAILACSLLWVLRLPGNIQFVQRMFWLQPYENFWHQGLLLFTLTALALLFVFIILERKEHFSR